MENCANNTEKFNPHNFFHGVVFPSLFNKFFSCTIYPLYPNKICKR